MPLLALPLAVIAALLAIPVLVLAVQVAAALLFHPRPVPLHSRRPRVAVLVPAHDEAAGITATLTGLLDQLAPGDRLLVVADNCSDATARIARSLGAEVLERQDPSRRGKGYALDFGVRHLEADPPEVLVIVDADCLLAAGTLDLLARHCLAEHAPIQAMDLMHSPPGAGLKTRVAEFAWLVKNQVRPQGFYCLDLPCQLMGTGMAIPWTLISGMPLASGHIAEDMKLGLDLANSGFPARFCPEGRVTSQFPSTESGLQTQRTRWEHGHLGLIAGELPVLLSEALGRRSGQLLALALDLAVPPLTFLCLLILAATILAGLLHALGGPALPLILALGDGGLLALSILAAWWGFGRRILSFGNLLAALGYALWKLPLYLKFALGRQVDWIRTRRDEP